MGHADKFSDNKFSCACFPFTLNDIGGLNIGICVSIQKFRRKLISLALAFRFQMYSVWSPFPAND